MFGLQLEVREAVVVYELLEALDYQGQWWLWILGCCIQVWQWEGPMNPIRSNPQYFMEGFLGIPQETLEAF